MLTHIPVRVRRALPRAMQLFLVSALWLATCSYAAPQNRNYNQNYNTASQTQQYSEANQLSQKLQQQQVVPIISQNTAVNFDGSYQYSFESGDGTNAQQQGALKTIGADNLAGEVSQGGYSYVGSDGKTYSIQYTADENGYRAQGDHLPTPPPIPPEIAKSLQYLATAPPFKDPEATDP